MLDESAWLAICFIIFVLVGYRPLKRMILSFLDERIKQIKLEIDTAKTAKRNASIELDAFKEDLGLIENRHAEIIRIAKIEIEKKFEERCIKFEKSVEYTRNSAKEHIELMQKDAVAAIEREFLNRVLNLVSNYFEKKDSTELDLAIVSNNLRQRK
jgi:F0F1-type ATP synthase membrane subunit b/b'